MGKIIVTGGCGYIGSHTIVDLVENGYDVIFGASGEGNIMYATDELNITSEVLAYCNKKYSGK